MKKFTITLALSILAVLLVITPCNAKGKAKHVVLIGLDGWGAYSVPKADIPTIKQLMGDGAYTLEKRSALPSSSAINWASMFMGAGPELHGYTQWGSKTPELPSRELNQHGIFPTMRRLPITTSIPRLCAQWRKLISKRNSQPYSPSVLIILTT